MLVGKQVLYLKHKGRVISVVIKQFCCTIVKCGNLKLWMNYKLIE